MNGITRRIFKTEIRGWVVSGVDESGKPVLEEAEPITLYSTGKKLDNEINKLAKKAGLINSTVSVSDAMMGMPIEDFVKYANVI